MSDELSFHEDIDTLSNTCMSGKRSFPRMVQEGYTMGINC